MPGTWRHLAARFFRSAVAQPLTSVELEAVRAQLNPPEMAMFLAQPVLDQRHGFEAWERTAEARPDRGDLQRAALLHDIGKRHAELGIIGRVLASALSKMRLPVRGRFRSYLAHGTLGADELEATGAEQLIVDFARCHHHHRPATIAQADWDLLTSNDY